MTLAFHTSSLNAKDIAPAEIHRADTNKSRLDTQPLQIYRIDG